MEGSHPWLLARILYSLGGRLAAVTTAPTCQGASRVLLLWVGHCLPPRGRSETQGPSSGALPPPTSMVPLIQLVVGEKEKEAGTPTPEPVGLGRDPVTSRPLTCHPESENLSQGHLRCGGQLSTCPQRQLL